MNDTLNDYTFIVNVSATSREQAEQVMRERINYEEELSEVGDYRCEFADTAHVVVLGNVIDGVTIEGPFFGVEQAIECGEDSGMDWCMTTIERMDK